MAVGAVEDESTPEPVVEVSTDEEQVLRVSNTSNPQSVAAAVAHALYDHKRVTLRAIGASAVNQAVKSLAIAAGFVGSRGLSLAVRPGFANVTGRDDKDLSAIVLIVFTV